MAPPKNRPLELLQLRELLLERYRAILDPQNQANNEDKTRNLLSRSLAIFCLQNEVECTVSQGVSAIVDGGDDNGLDAIFYDQGTHQMFLIQCKWINGGIGEPALGDVSKFVNGVQNFMNGEISTAASNNQFIQQKASEITQALDDENLQVRCILVHSGGSILSADRKRLFENLRVQFNHDREIIRVESFGLDRMHSWVTQAGELPGIPEVSLDVHYPGWVTQPYPMIYGLISANVLRQLYAQNTLDLIAANIRNYKGSTEVNETIKESIEQSPTDFPYLNNGLTAYCRKFNVKHTDRGNNEKKSISVKGLSIVNGAQTLGAISASNENPDDPFVFIKIISLELTEEPMEFAHRITVSTNLQNQVEPRDLTVARPEHEAIAQTLLVSEIIYSFKKTNGNWPVKGAKAFDADEAITAAACLVRNAKLWSRVLANRPSLWEIGEPTDIPWGFNATLGAVIDCRKLWRAVQIQRKVVEITKNAATTETGVRKAYFENCRWLLLGVVFIKFQGLSSEELYLTNEELNAVTIMTQNFSEKLWDACVEIGHASVSIESSSTVVSAPRHFRSVFSNPSDCEQIMNKLMEKISN